VGGSYAVPVVNNLLDIAGGVGESLLQPEDLDFIVFVFENLKLLLVVQQIHALSPVNFEK